MKTIFSYQEPYGNVEIAGMISDEEMWPDALVARNNVPYAYNRAIALDIVHQAKEKYYDMFLQLERTIERNWL